MIKLLSGVFVGVFMGALVYEIINRENPEWLEKIRNLAGCTNGCEEEGLDDPDLDAALD
jgi:hypothetical protein